MPAKQCFSNNVVSGPFILVKMYTGKSKAIFIHLKIRLTNPLYMNINNMHFMKNNYILLNGEVLLRKVAVFSIHKSQWWA